MVYDCWTEIKITNRSNVPLKLARSSREWGKFYSTPNKNKEVYPEDLNGKTINGGSIHTIGACGRNAALSGCEGQFDLIDNNGNTVCTAFFHSPHGTSYNNFRVDVPSPRTWGLDVNGGYLGNDRALGRVYLYIDKL